MSRKGNTNSITPVPGARAGGYAGAIRKTMRAPLRELISALADHRERGAKPAGAGEERALTTGAPGAAPEIARTGENGRRAPAGRRPGRAAPAPGVRVTCPRRRRGRVGCGAPTAAR